MPSNIFQESQGGTHAATIYSGQAAPVVTQIPGAFATGSDIMFWSGAGQLVDVMIHNTVSGLLASGALISFYDAHTPVSGGPIPTSGHVLLFQLPAIPVTANAPLSGNQFQLFIPKITINLPFNSGLCVNTRSGSPPVTFSWRGLSQPF